MPPRRTLVPLLVTLAPLAAQAGPAAAPPAADVERWEGEIAALESLDAAEPDPEGAVLLLGSSSIVMWESAAADLAPYPVIRRGFGGATFADLAHFAERLVSPHRFRAAVVFVANDVAGGPDDHTPEQVGAWFRHVVGVIRAREPAAPIICCDVRPTPLREHVWKSIEAVNAALKEACEERAGVHYLETAAAYWGPDGRARTDVYLEDRLHLNEAGYELWSGQIKSALDRVLEAGRPADSRD